MHKSKEARKARLDIVAMHDPDRVKKNSALMQSISLTPLCMSLSLVLESEKVYTKIPWIPFGKRHIPTMTGLKKHKFIASSY